MINKKLAGLLAATLLSSIIQPSAEALSTSATQIVQANLGTYLDIQAITDGTTLLTNIDPDLGGLTAELVSKFRVRYNNTALSQALYLQATTVSNTPSNENAFFSQGSNVYLILSNTTNKPSPAAIADCKASPPTPANNANAIAYSVSGVTLTPAGTAPSYDDVKNQYNISVAAGETIVTTTIGQSVLPTTYSFLDTAGTYEATLKLTITPL